MRYIKIIKFFLLSILISNISFAQQIELGLNAGGASYMGDLNQYNPVKITGLSAGAFVKVNFDPYWAVGLHYNYGKVKGADSLSKFAQERDRNLSFYTPLNEVSLLLNFNFIDLFSPAAKKRLSPYLFAGVGILNYEPKTKYQGEEYLLRLYNTEGQTENYKKFTVTIPFGGGVKYRYTEHLTIFGQAGFRSPLTDYIDDVSGVYPNRNSWPNGGLGPVLSDRSGEKTGLYLGDPGTQRGDFRKRDNYMFVGIGISYTFVSQKCFTF
ncbi:MAG: hypothetical protein EOO47_10865 [Flavobacterium sp.]|nr:MAG: hypothetical protein EOO47_10865 [Flavobacterium sp.]